MKHTTRILAAWLALCAVLFSQLALASYACPFLAAPAEMAAPMPGSGCGAMPADEDRPALCHAYCQVGDQSLAQSPAGVPDMIALPVPPIARMPDAAAAGIAPGEQLSLLARATAPSVALRLCCLRI